MAVELWSPLCSGTFDWIVCFLLWICFFPALCIVDTIADHLKMHYADIVHCCHHQVTCPEKCPAVVIIEVHVRLVVTACDQQ